MKVFFFLSPQELRNWLEQNHEKQAEVWVGFYKKESGRPSVTYTEAVDEALCFGWIDGVRRSVDAQGYEVRFTPRKAKSKWSAVNVERARTLIAADRMHPAGLKAFESAMDNSRIHSYEERNAAKFAACDEKTFHANKAAWEFFQSRPSGYQRTTTFWVTSAKKEATRQKRLATLIAVSASGKVMDLLTGKPVVPKR